jgi:hypothetical protein
MRDRSGRVRSRRVHFRRVGWLALPVALLALAWAAPSDAARVIDLRVGRHAEFTRVVVELDAPAGYKIEHHEPKPGISELVVSLDATGAARRIAGAKRRIDSVTLEGSGPGQSIIRIRLSRQGLRLKEMILAGPPRIVLDVMGGEPETRTARVTPPPPPKATPPPEPEPAATPEPEPEPEVAQAPTPSEVEEEAAAEPTPVALPEPVAAAEPEEAAPAEEAGAGAFDEFGAGDETGSDEVAMAETDEVPAEAAPEATPPTPAARPATPVRRAMPQDEGLPFSTTHIAIAAGGVLLLIGGFVVARRRKAARKEMEAAESDALGGDHPFAGFGEGQAETGADAATVESQVAETAELFDAPTDTTGGPAEPSLFDAESDESPEKEIEGVEMETATSGIDLAAGPTAAGGDEVMRLVRELERRVTSLETRLDEAVDAKERLERQVAAQTEELRVQRAAIARTQRAVRNLTRPDEEGATEPARREG